MNPALPFAFRESDKENYRPVCTHGISPFGDADDLEKFRHALEIGQRVIVRHSKTGETHRGEITNFGSGTALYVELDSGHMIECLESEVTPEDFPEAESEEEKIAKSARFSVGDQVKEKHSGRAGTVIRAMPEGAAEINFGKGCTGICLTRHIEPA